MFNERNDNKLKSNIISSGIYQILIMVVPILTTPYVTRIFKASEMGEFNFSLTIAGLFVTFAQFGIETFGSREIAKSGTDNNRNAKYFKFLSIQLVTSIFMFILYNLLFIFILNFDNKHLYFVQSLLILVNIFDISWYFIGIEEIRKTIFRNSITKLFTTISIFIFVNDPSQLNLYALINILGMLIGNISMIISSRKYVDYNRRIFGISKKYFNGSFKLLIPRLMNTSYGSIEKGILKFSTTSSSVGIYSEAQKIINLAFSVIDSSFNALMPRIAYHVAKKEYTKVNEYLYKGLTFSGFFSIIMVSGIFAVSTDFVDFFYGEGYESVAHVLEYMGLALLFIPIISLLSKGILIPSGKDKEYTISILLKLIAGIVLNFTLDFKLGANGAALSYVGIQLFSLIYIIYTTRKLMSTIKIINNLMNSIIGIVINVVIINSLSKFIIFKNSIISFLFFGVTSLIISGVIILIFVIIGLKKGVSVVRKN